MFKKLSGQLSQFLSKVKEKELTEKDIRDSLKELKMLLIRNDVALEAAERIIEDAKRKIVGRRSSRFSKPDQIIKQVLRESLFDLLTEVKEMNVEEILKKNRREGMITKIVFIGINGVGKTLTIAKLAYMLKKKGYKIVLACSDTFRAGAIEQLEKHSEVIGVEMIKRPYGADPASVAYDAIAHAIAKKMDAVLIDTAGRMHVDVNLMNELRKIVRVAEPDLTILVVDALAGHDALLQSKRFMKDVGFDGIIVAKVDANPSAGCIISMVYQVKKPILFLGTGSRYSDIKQFNVNEFLLKIMGM